MRVRKRWINKSIDDKKYKERDKKWKSEVFFILFISEWRRISDIIIFDALIIGLKGGSDHRFELDEHKLWEKAIPDEHAHELENKKT